MARCKAKNTDGARCKAPESVVGDNGFCPAHSPGGSERMRERGKKGAEATKKKWRAAGLAESDLPPLKTHEDAKEWLEVTGRATATGRLPYKDATAIVKCVEAWLKAEGERLTVEVTEELRGEVERLQKELQGRPRLSVER